MSTLKLGPSDRIETETIPIKRQKLSNVAPNVTSLRDLASTSLSSQILQTSGRLLGPAPNYTSTALPTYSQQRDISEKHVSGESSISTNSNQEVSSKKKK